MGDNRKNIGIYKRLKPYPVSFFAMLFVYLFFLTIIDGMCIFLVVDFIIQRDWGGMIFAAAVMGATSFFMIRSARKNLRYKKRLADQRIKVRDSLSFNELAELETEIISAERMWGTLYFLDRFLYVPKTRLLIEYENIERVKIVTHYTDGLRDGARIILTDGDGTAYEFWILKFKRFFDEQEFFEKKIAKKRTPKFNYTEEKANV